MTSVLSLCQDAAVDLSLVQPSTLDTSLGDPTTAKLVRQLTRTCRQLAARYDWQRLRREKTFVTVAAAIQTSAIPTDFLRFVPETMYNRDRNRRVLGPLTSGEWQSYQAALTTPIFDNFYMRGNDILITPTPSPAENVYYEYISKYIGTDSTGATERLTFSTDDDLAYFDDELIISGIVWRYRKAEGLDYAEEYREFEQRFADMVKQDGGRRVIDMNDNLVDRTPNVQGGNLDYLVTV